MRTLVTGGAGYIGSHVVKMLCERADYVLVVDDLVTGDVSRLDRVAVHQMDLASDGAPGVLSSLLREHQIDAVIHFAARKQVAESVAHPAWYFQQNIGSLANVLLGMRDAGVSMLVFSSSAAVYGATQGPAISEAESTVPVSPYGETKLVGEHLVEASTRAFDLRAVSLRYFNVAGAGSPVLADKAALNLVPMTFERIDAGVAPIIFGDDYRTPDGTCVRDYLHVVDLAEAHLATLDYLSGVVEPGHSIFNVGTGIGTSVREMVDAILRVTMSRLASQVGQRRAGDPAWVVASPARFAECVGWQARLGLDDIVGSAWRAHEYAKELGHSRRPPLSPN